MYARTDATHTPHLYPIVSRHIDRRPHPLFLTPTHLLSSYFSYESHPCLKSLYQVRQGQRYGVENDHDKSSLRHSTTTFWSLPVDDFLCHRDQNPDLIPPKTFGPGPEPGLYHPMSFFKKKKILSQRENNGSNPTLPC